MDIYKGRFAPTPSGDLHFGSFITATASYLDALANQGDWFVRIDDVDRSREVKGSADSILQTLEAFGFEWSGKVSYQSQHTRRYEYFAEQLLSSKKAYACSCSRKELSLRCCSSQYGAIYDGLCRDKQLIPSDNLSLRVRANGTISINDQIKRVAKFDLESTFGDFIIKRADGIFSYLLAVVVDDNDLGITHVIRGGDLFPLTAQQQYVQQLLEFRTPLYGHLPIVLDDRSKKLSKSSNATSIVSADKSKTLIKALTMLNQSPPADLESAPVNEIWEWAKQNWRIANISSNQTFEQKVD